MSLEKRFIAFLLSVMMIISMVPATEAYAYEKMENDLDTLCLDNVFAKTKEDGVLTYTLQDDYTVDADGINIITEGSLVIDLNGHVLAVNCEEASPKLFNISGKVDVTITNGGTTAATTRYFDYSSGELISEDEIDDDDDWKADLAGGTLCVFSNYYDATNTDAVITVSNGASLRIGGSVDIYNGIFEDVGDSEYIEDYWGNDYSDSEINNLFYVGLGATLNLTDIALVGIREEICRYGELDKPGEKDAKVSVMPAVLSAGNTITNYGTVNLTNCIINSCGDVDSSDYEHLDDYVPYRQEYATKVYCDQTPAIYNAGVLTVSNCEIDNSPIYNDTNGHLDLQDTQIYSINAYAENYTYGGADLEVARVYNKGAVSVGGSTRVSDLLCELNGGIVMVSGSSLTVTDELERKVSGMAKEYTSIPSIMVSCTLDFLGDYMEATSTDLQIPNVTVTYAEGITPHAFDLGVSMYSRIAGVDLIKGAFAPADYTESDINVSIKDVVLNSESTTAALDLSVVGLRSGDIKYIQQYLKILEVAVDSKLSAGAISAAIRDAYLGGFFTRVSDLILNIVNKYGGSRLTALQEIFAGQTDTIDGLARSYLATVLGALGFTDEAEEKGNETLKIDAFDSRDNNPKDLTIIAFDRSKGEGRQMVAHVNNVLYDDSLYESFMIMALLANGEKFDRAVDMTGTAIATCTDFQKAAGYSYSYNSSFSKYYVNDINVDLQSHAAFAYRTAYECATQTNLKVKEASEAAIKAYAKDISILSNGYYYYSGDKIVSGGGTFASGLTVEEIEAVVQKFNQSKDAIDWSTGKLPDELLFNAYWTASGTVKKYYSEKLESVKNDSNVIFDIAYELLTGGTVLDSATTVGATSIFTLLNNALEVTLSASAKTGALNISIGANEAIGSIVGLPKKICEIIYKNKETSKVVEKYADILYFNTDSNKKGYDFPTSFDGVCSLIETIISDAGFTSYIAQFIDPDGMADAEEYINLSETKQDRESAEATKAAIESKAIDKLIGWLKNPETAGSDILSLSVVDSLPGTLSQLGIGFNRVIGLTKGSSGASDTVEISDTAAQSISGLLKTYGRYELSMIMGKSTIVLSSEIGDLTSSIKGKSLMGYSLGNIYIGHINILPCKTGSSPVVSSVALNADGTSASVTIIGDPALCYETGSGITNPTITYWPAGSDVKTTGKTVKGKETANKTITIARGEKSVDYFCTYSVEYRNKTYVSAPTKFTIPSYIVGQLCVYSSEGSIELVNGKTPYASTTSSATSGVAFLASDTDLTVFEDLPLGVYNLTVSSGDVVKTYFVQVTTKAGTGKSIKAAAYVDGGKTSYDSTDSYLVVDLSDAKNDLKTQIVDKTTNKDSLENDKDMSEIVVSGLNKIDIATNSGLKTYSTGDAIDNLRSSSDTKLVLEVENITKPGVREKDAIQTEAEKESTYTAISYIDLSVYLRDTVTPTNQAKVSALDKLITVYIPYDTSRYNIHIYRYHNGEAKEIPYGAANAVDGEYYEIDGAYIVLHVKYFSTYAVSYSTEEPVTESISYSDPTYSITGANTENGKITLSRKYATYGDKVTITVAADEGYVLSSLTVTDASGKERPLTNLGGGKYSFIMLASDVTVSASFVAEKAAGKCPQDATCILAKFVDVDTKAWYHDGVHFCVENKYMGGTGVDTFAPTASLSRGMVVTMLWRMEGSPSVAASTSYTDVPADQWYSTAVAWAEVNHIAGGYGSGKFGPEDAITREQLANVFYRYAQFKGYSVTEQADIASKFTDAASTHSWAEVALKWSNAVALINGKENNRLDPTGNASRAEAATILKNFCEKIMK